MNQGAVAYLQQNKNKYSKEVLIEELKKAGYSDLDIIDSAKLVFTSDYAPSAYESLKTNFWDFKSERVYIKPSEKWKDFLFGLFAPWIANFCISLLSLLTFVAAFLGLGLFVFEIIAAVYLFNRRRFIFYGIIASFAIGAVISVFIFILIMFTFSRHSFF